MKMKKKSVALCAFVVGSALLATSAFADMYIGSGYEGAKESAKKTAAYLYQDAGNFTMNASFSVKMDDAIIAEGTQNAKVDREKDASENTSSSNRSGETEEWYSYSDKEQYIHRDQEGKYYVTKRSTLSESSRNDPENPFDREEVQDMEKILDAFVGNLKDAVSVQETDNKKIYNVSLEETQVPTLANAVTSYVVKYGMLDEYTAKELGISRLTNDIFVKEVAGKVTENSDGYLENIIGKIALSGKDKDGDVHTLSLEMVASLEDIGSTTVTAPDLSDADVEYNEAMVETYTVNETYIGTYKSDIVKSTSSELSKIGERILTIDSVNDGAISGTYKEVYTDGTEGGLSFTYEGTVSKDRYMAVLTYTNAQGEEENGIMRLSGRTARSIDLDLNVILQDDGGMSYRSSGPDEGMDSTFIRVFE